MKPPFPFALVFFYGKLEGKELPPGWEFLKTSESPTPGELECLLVTPVQEADAAMQQAVGYIALASSVAGPFTNDADWEAYGKAVSSGTGGATPAIEVARRSDRFQAFPGQVAGEPYFLVYHLNSEANTVVAGVEVLISSSQSNGIGLMLVQAPNKETAKQKGKEALGNPDPLELTVASVRGPFGSRQAAADFLKEMAEIAGR